MSKIIEREAIKDCVAEYCRKDVRFILKNQYPYVEVYATREDVLRFAKARGFKSFDYENSIISRAALIGFMYVAACEYGLSNNFRKMHGYKQLKRTVLRKQADRYVVVNK